MYQGERERERERKFIGGLLERCHYLVAAFASLVSNSCEDVRKVKVTTEQLT